MFQVIDFFKSNPDLAQLCGILGFGIYITSFLSVQTGRLCGNSIHFPMLQVTAASLVLISLTSAYNLASFLIQTSYICIGLFGICLRLLRARNARHRPPDPTRPARILKPTRNLLENDTSHRHKKVNGESLPSLVLCSRIL